MPSFELENQFKNLVVGIDEAGCGPWAGPVVAAAALFLDVQNLSHTDLHDINDSKKLSKSRREKVFRKLTALESKHFCYGIGVVSPSEIDNLNIRKATHLAMRRSYGALVSEALLDESVISCLLIDGIADPEIQSRTGERLETQLIKKGDSISYSIAAASIFAKVTRDRMMEALHSQFPEYGWNQNAGYGTKAHQEAILRSGVSDHHRKSFAPIKRVLEVNRSVKAA